MTLKERWNAESPKLYAVLGNIAMWIGLVSIMLTASWDQFGDTFKQYLPQWLPTIIAGVGFLGKVLCKLTYVKDLVDKNKDLIKE